MGKREIGMRILITGANRGLGYEFVKQYLDRGDEVIAGTRDPQNAEMLGTLEGKYNNLLALYQLDVTDLNSIQTMREDVETRFESLDLLINNAAIISGGSKKTYPLGEFHSENIAEVFNVNAIAPLMMVEEFAEILSRGEGAKIINITSMMGSIGSRTGASYYSYCASKSALNMFSRLLSFDLKNMGIIVLALHPGHVKTDMGGSAAPLFPEESIRGMISLIDSITEADSGKFLDWEGGEIPW
jgi:NAD(P)-dependent dehydrogenase (short-subunit alcohol dehydrogenase family)